MMFGELLAPAVTAAVISGLFGAFVAVRTKRMERGIAVATVRLQKLDDAQAELAAIPESEYGGLARLANITGENQHRQALNELIERENEKDAQAERIFQVVGPALFTEDRIDVNQYRKRADAFNERLATMDHSQLDRETHNRYLVELLEHRLAFRNALRGAVDRRYSKLMDAK